MYLFHRRRIKTEEKAKVVAAVWGTELIKFLAALAFFHQDDLKKGTNSFKKAIGKELFQFCPQAATTTCAVSSIYLFIYLWI